ncbi:hybrid sensor histidine kinase/response regulator [Azospirillum rugosum]|uniref:histidine kinase n=1 Tax=Azospirillum rugosum TaxID=416170 RepID=A0ABS4STD8_9PROT|nr:ATP-binding protein [Azospirillum rugosum]MBP2295836.1 PAS domain S-box-containing protein [Azospirillum rugosum]MDQ0529053.1 PAS domain S-box-containing protein [Azospirillum rugosum]
MQATLRRSLVLLSLIMLPLLGVELAMQFNLRRERMAELHDQAMRLLDGVETEQQHLIDDVHHILGTLATAAAPQLAGPGCQATLDRMQALLPPYLVVEVMGMDGHVRCATDRRAIGAYIGKRENVQRALATGDFVLGNYATARRLGYAVLTFGQPFEGPDGSTAGVVTALLDIGWLHEFLARKPLPPDATILIADRSGRVFARTPALPDVVGQYLPERLRYMLTGSRRATVEATGLDGVKRIMAYSSTEVGAEGILVMAGIDKAAAMGSIDRSLWRTMAMFVGVLALCYAGVAWGASRLVRVQEQLVLALKAAKAGTFGIRLRSRRAEWSEETFRIFGLDPQRDAPGFQTWAASLHPADRDRVLREREAALADRTPTISQEYRILRRDGTVGWVETVANATYAGDGTPLRLSGLHIDITHRKETEGALRAAKEEAERANLSKSKFLAAASHDLRQPMQSMFLFASALHPHVTSERGRNALTMLERGLDTMKGLLESLLDVSRFDAGGIRPAIEDVPLRPVLDHIAASYLPVAAAKGLQLRVREGRDMVVRSDRNLLGRMIRNLVENAIRYTEAGIVELDCREADGRVHIDVLDTGIGIPAGQLDRIFEEFHQLANPERDRGQGLGLGLSIVQRLSTLLDHPVLVRSEPGRGSVFSIAVPLGNAGEPGTQPAAQPVLEDGAGRLALLVDDDSIVLLALQTMFRSWRYETLIAASAEEAIEKLRADGREPDVIVADYRLRGGERGTDTVRRITAFLGSAVPAIILTGETSPEWQKEAADLGFGVAFKPVTPRQLQEALQRCMGAVA